MYIAKKVSKPEFETIRDKEVLSLGLKNSRPEKYENYKPAYFPCKFHSILQN